MNTLIESLGVYLPPREVSTDEVLRGCRTEIRFPLERLTGIKSRHVAGEGEFAIDLAKEAIARCLAASRHGPGDVDLLISACIARVDGPDFLVSYEPSTALRLKQHFGFHKALAFDVRSACSGMWAGVYIADTLIREGVIERALVVSGEYITHLTTTAQIEIEELLDPRLACLTLGDSGAAVMLEATSEPGVGFDALDLRTFSAYAEQCVAGPTEQPHGGAIMFTDALQLTDVAARHGADHALATLERAGWARDAFEHLIMHQTSRTALTSAVRAINRLLKRRVCHEGNTIDNLERRGNTATTTHFVALADNIQCGRIRSGDRIIFAVSGSGLTLGTALYTLDDLPDRLTGRATGPSTDGHPAPQAAPAQTPRIRIASLGAVPPGDAEHRDSVTLLARAAEDCLSRSPYGRDGLDLLIYAGIYRTRFITEPAMAALLAGAMRVPTTLAFDVFNGAVGVLNACWVAQQILRLRKAKTAMVAVAEVENNAGDFPDELLGIEETASTLLLDAASESEEGFSAFLFRVFPEHNDAFTSYLTNRDGKAYLRFARDADLERHYVAAIVSTVQELVRRERLELSSIARIFPPQISSPFITCLSEALDLPRERFVDVVEGGRDLSTSSLAFALRHARDQSLVRSGDLGLLIAAGSGIQVGCALYYF